MTTDPVTWFEVHTPDPTRSKTFYGQLFGWTFNDEVPGYSTVLLGDAAPIGGGIASTGPAHRPMTVFNIQVPDVQASCDAVEGAGGKVAMPPQTTPDGLHFAYLTDPDGSTFGVWTPPPAS
ncbi:MAG TPA: VOC family protein [Euzebya sp.]|nr:VOC family protein [Euzebya sp.]